MAAELRTVVFDAVNRGDLKATKEALKTRKNPVKAVNSRNEHGLTPLHLASKNGHLDVVKFLVKTGAKIESLWGRGPRSE